MSKLKLFSSRLADVCAQSSEARCWVENEDVVGAAPTDDAPTTSEWSTILLPTKVRLILETWRYALSHIITGNCLTMREDHMMSSSDSVHLIPVEQHIIKTYLQTLNIISRTLVGNKIVDHADEVEESPFGAAPVTSSFST